MPRPLRIEYEGAIYHVMNRGDRREAIYHDDDDRCLFLKTLGNACEKTGWRVHAYCLMGNHFHLVVETPQANLVVGMKWLLGAYTSRFNRRHGQGGHVFGGRYKAQHIDERHDSYLVTACDYVHLNPARAFLITREEPLERWPWSSFPAYLRPRLRGPWLRVDRVLGEHGLARDRAADRDRYRRHLETLRAEERWEVPQLKRGWRHGAEDFVELLATRLGRRGAPDEGAQERRETDEQWALRLVSEALQRQGLDQAALSQLPKGHAVKIQIARDLRTRTPMTRAWIATQLKMGSTSYVSALLSSHGVDDSKN